MIFDLLLPARTPTRTYAFPPISVWGVFFASAWSFWVVCTVPLCTTVHYRTRQRAQIPKERNKEQKTRGFGRRGACMLACTYLMYIRPRNRHPAHEGIHIPQWSYLTTSCGRENGVHLNSIPFGGGACMPLKCVICRYVSCSHLTTVHSYGVRHSISAKSLIMWARCLVLLCIVH